MNFNIIYQIILSWLGRMIFYNKSIKYFLCPLSLESRRSNTTKPNVRLRWVADINDDLAWK
jgi:hypothetical protein